MEIKQITAEESRPLRHQILRPHQTLADCIYPGDEIPESFHMGAYIDKELVCIASFFPQKTERLPQSRQYRLRGMGTIEAYRGRSIGASVLAEGERIAKEKGYELIWCNARTSACPYYEKQGYLSFEHIFDIPGIGPHKVMYKNL